MIKIIILTELDAGLIYVILRVVPFDIIASEDQINSDDVSLTSTINVP